MKSTSRFLTAGLAVLAFASLVSAQSHLTTLNGGGNFNYQLPLTLSADGTLYGVMDSSVRIVKTDGTFIADVAIPEMGSGYYNAAVKIGRAHV